MVLVRITASAQVHGTAFPVYLWDGRWALAAVRLYGPTTTSLGNEGSRKCAPRDWFDATVSGRFSDESSIFLFQDPVV